MTFARFPLTGIVMLYLALTAHAQNASFRRVDGVVNAVSADGLYWVGTVGREAYRWSAASGMRLHPPVTFGESRSANGVSADGSVVAGYSSYSTLADTYVSAAFWTPGGGGPHGSLSPESDRFPPYYKANDVSGNGLWVAGLTWLRGSISQAIRWYPDGRGLLLGNGEATGISSDGTVVVGWSATTSGSEAFRWFEFGGMIGLGDLPGGEEWSAAYDVSANGSIVVGVGSSALGPEAFRWTAGGMIGLGDLPSGSFSSVANAVADDGSVVVGSSQSAAGQAAFIWDAVHGMRDLRELLVNEYGLAAELEGWTLLEAKDVSRDGRTIVGRGNVGGFVAYIPEPSTIILASIFGLVFLASRLTVAREVSLGGSNFLFRHCRIFRTRADHTEVSDLSIRWQ